MPPSPRGPFLPSEYSYHNDRRHKERTVDRLSDTIPEPDGSQSRRRSGLVIDREKPSRYGSGHPDRDTIVSKTDVGARVPPSLTPLSISRTHGHDGKRENYDHVTDRDDTKSYTISPTMPRARRPDQQRLSSSRPRSDERAEFVTSSKGQYSSTGASTSGVLDFTRRSPRKYIHQKGGQSGLSAVSSATNSIANKQTDLEEQTDCASALTKAVRQRYGKELWQKQTRKFDYGMD